ncbi:XisI protein [Brasilonema sp. UFV-L1]|nr:XisI protein [Brasilonema sp. UFV-L1]
MDKLTKYREIVRKVISEYTTHKPYHGQIDVGAIIDQYGSVKPQSQVK